jgi:hypothetical protein
LRDHGVKDGGNIISSNGGVSQTENACFVAYYPE